MSDEYDALLAAEKKLSASSAAILLDLWLAGKVTLAKENVTNMVAKLDSLLTRVESRAGRLGWFDEDNLPDADELDITKS